MNITLQASPQNFIDLAFFLKHFDPQNYSKLQPSWINIYSNEIGQNILSINYQF
jgi:hypothetical protein